MKFFAFLLLSLISLQAQESSEGNVSSLEASYNGDTLILQGNVKLNHGLGDIEADEAVLSKQDSTNKDLPFSLIHLTKNIYIDCKNRAKISCGTAVLDFAALNGLLTAGEKEHVTYYDSLTTGIPIQIFSKKAFLTLKSQNSTSFAIDRLTATDNVVISYGSDYVLQAQEAVYQKTATLGSLIQGFGSPCVLFYQKKPIEMAFIEIDTEKDSLYLKEPKGSLPSTLFSSKKEGDLFFQCKELYWDQKEETLKLKNDVLVQESQFGTIDTNEEMVIKRKNNAIESIHVEGKSKLSHNLSSLLCFGSLHVDGVKGQISALSSDSKQLLYTDSSLSLQADEALLEYEPSSNQPSALTLHKNVQIRSHDPATPQRYGLADHLRYVPATKTVIMLADPGKKVLFWDEAQGITLSAKEVHLTQNPLTGKAEIQGIGNLKLSLSPEELSLLKNRFPDQPTKSQLKDEVHE